MQAKREYRDRDATEVAVLDALVDRGREGMTVLELRSHVDAEIDQLEGALADLKTAGLIEVTSDGERMVIRPDERVVPDRNADGDGPSLLERLRRWLPF
jgi:DNA-binding transcriptional ArsR family regulator